MFKNMWAFLVRRGIGALTLLFVIATLACFLLDLLPGDPVRLLLGDVGGIDEQTIAAWRTRLGLDQPVLTRYLRYLKGITKGDLGESLFSKEKVSALLIYRLPKSLELIVTALIAAAVIGIPLGTIAGYKRGTFWDSLINVFAAVGISVPVYVIGLLVVIAFAVRLKFLPASGYVLLNQDPVEHFRHLLLPAFTLFVTQFAQIARIARSSAIDVLGQEYVRTARAKGLAEARVAAFHVLRNSLIPVITIVGLQFGRLFGSMVLIESLFNWPGISSLLISSVTRRDYPVVQGVLLLIGIIIAVSQFLVDVAYAWLDPRVKYE